MAVTPQHAHGNEWPWPPGRPKIEAAGQEQHVSVCKRTHAHVASKVFVCKSAPHPPIHPPTHESSTQYSYSLSSEE